ncbi:MAG: 3-hydroxyacyl-CoA dehydrogenase family protein [Trueperaceae bacterium]
MTSVQTNTTIQASTKTQSGFQTVAVLGAGVMGKRITCALLQAGIKTRLFDVRKNFEVTTKPQLIAALESHYKDMSIPKALEPLTFAVTLAEAVQGADLVIETIPENVDLKRQILQDISSFVTPETIVVTNTSSIVGSRLADAYIYPAMFLNFNFGGYETRKVEIMGHPGTQGFAIDAVERFISELGLVPLRVQREIMGYAGNRVWRAIKKEVLFLIQNGYATPEDIDRGWMLEWGTPMGPCGIMDEVGLDVIRDIENVYYAASGKADDAPPAFLEAMIQQGKLGQKSGEGFYHYPNPAYAQPDFLQPKSG